MYKPRNIYFTTNQGNLVERIMSSDKFTRYEYMALRYACCESISEVDYILSGSIVPCERYHHIGYIACMRRIDIKKLKKSYQRCINHLDKCCFKGE